MKRSSLARTGMLVACGLLSLTGCDLLLTDPAPATPDVTVSFQVVGAPLGGNAAAFSRVRRAALRFTRPDASFRDTVVAVISSEGVARAGVALQTGERVEALGIGAQLGFGTTTLFEGATVVPIIPGLPTTAQIPLLPVPAAVRADRPTATFANVGASQTFTSAVLFATGDTIEGAQGVWSSVDPSVVAITPLGVALATGVGLTLLEVRFLGLADTVRVDVVSPMATR